ncbi:MAG: hypothetical protein M1816_005101 [Peltula sp. TS41687]|nr:MAG: hypothetical protein M1816_005101 [Peltula sp. TS41687]
MTSTSSTISPHQPRPRPHPHNNPTSPALKFHPPHLYPLSPTYSTWVKLTTSDIHNLQPHPSPSHRLLLPPPPPGGHHDTYYPPNIYFHLNHPIRYVRLVGTFISLETYDRRWLMLLDDFTGGRVVEVVCLKPAVAATRGVIGGAGGVAGQGQPQQQQGEEEEEEENREQEGDVEGVPRILLSKDVDDLLGKVVKVKGCIGEFRGEKQVVLKRLSIIKDTNEEVACWRELCAFRKDVLSKPWVVDSEEEKRFVRDERRREEREKRRRRERRRRREKEEEERMIKAGKENLEMEERNDMETIRRMRMITTMGKEV